eukprot:1445149-Amphidinium_carterae.1
MGGGNATMGAYELVSTPEFPCVSSMPRSRGLANLDMHMHAALRYVLPGCAPLSSHSSKVTLCCTCEQVIFDREDVWVLTVLQVLLPWGSTCDYHLA